MPEITPKLKIPKPLGNEYLNRVSYNEVLDAIENNAASEGAFGEHELKDASTTQKGHVQLNDTLTSVSITEALTANQGKVLKDLVDGKASSTDLSTLNTTVNEHLVDLISHGVYGTATGTNALVMTVEKVTAYVEGMLVAFKNTTANTGAVTLNINSLGAKSVKKANGNDLASGNLKDGGIYQLRYDGVNFILLGEGGEYGTATASQVLEGYTVGREEGIIVGTMTDLRGTNWQTYSEQVEDIKQFTGDSSQAQITFNGHPEGYTDSTTKHVAIIGGLNPNNIKAGVKIGNIYSGTAPESAKMTGTFTADANAVAGDILSGKTAYVNGAKVTGTIPYYTGHNKQALAPWKDATNVYFPVSESGYYNGSGNSGLYRTISEVLSLTGGSKKASGLTRASTEGYLEIRGLDFMPSAVVYLSDNYPQYYNGYGANINGTLRGMQKYSTSSTRTVAPVFYSDGFLISVYEGGAYQHWIAYE